MSYEKNAKRLVRFLNLNVNVVFSVIQNIMFRIFRIVDEGHLSRRFAVWASMGLTVYTALWCMNFIIKPPAQYDAAGVAAIIAAVMTPLSILTGAMMKFGEQYKGVTRQNEGIIKDLQPDSITDNLPDDEPK